MMISDTRFIHTFTHMDLLIDYLLQETYLPGSKLQGPHCDLSYFPPAI